MTVDVVDAPSGELVARATDEALSANTRASDFLVDLCSQSLWL